MSNEIEKSEYRAGGFVDVVIGYTGQKCSIKEIFKSNTDGNVTLTIHPQKTNLENIDHEIITPKQIE